MAGEQPGKRGPDPNGARLERAQVGCTWGHLPAKCSENEGQEAETVIKVGGGHGDQ